MGGKTEKIKFLKALNSSICIIPPLRLGGRLRWDGGPFRAGVGVTRVFEQSRVSAFEEETEGYTLSEASIGYRLFTGDLVHDFVLRGTTLFDVEARSHTSFVKELAPLPGRDLRLLYRIYF